MNFFNSVKNIIVIKIDSLKTLAYDLLWKKILQKIHKKSRTSFFYKNMA